MQDRHPSTLLLRLGAAWALAAAAHGMDEVAGTLVVLTDSAGAPNGAWSWFGDERAVVDDSDPANRLLLVGSVSAGGGAESGDVDVLWLNMDTGAHGAFELHDRFEQDDHDSPSLWVRPDGRYVAAYSRHGTDDFVYWRVSTRPHDPTSWGPEQAVDASGPSGDNATYNNLFHLPGDLGGAGRLYDFTRAVDWNPTVLTSYDHGSTWSREGVLLASSGSVRPYVRYATDGARIHLTATDGHPRDVNNNVYHGYVEDGRLFASDGTLLDGDLFDGAAVPPGSLTTVLAANTVLGGAPMTRAWNVDVAVDGAGRPCCVLQARIDPGALSGGQDSLDHLFLYGRYDPVAGAWTVHPLAPAGRDIYAASPNGSEDDYTGLAAIDPSDPNTVYLSTDVDPVGGGPLAHYEIFRGVTADGGATWTWDAITRNSSVDNLRPIVPAWGAGETALVWMRGGYGTYQSWSTDVVCITEITGLTTVPGTEPVTYVDATTANGLAPNTTLADGTAFVPPVTTGAAPADGRWWERTGFANGGNVIASSAASDAPLLRTTITGLDPGEDYELFVYAWWADPFGNGQWDIGAGFSPGAIRRFLYSEGAPASGPFAGGPILTQEGNRELHQYALGVRSASASGTIAVFIDDHPGNDDRTWYDGVGYVRAGPGGIGTPYCVATTNASGAPGAIAALGSPAVTVGDVTLRATSLPPNQFGIFVTSRTPDFVPAAGGASNGNLCLGGSIGRFVGPGEILATGPSGQFELALDLTALPEGAALVPAVPGDTWYFQAWHREPVALGSNFTDGLRIDLR